LALAHKQQAHPQIRAHRLQAGLAQPNSAQIWENKKKEERTAQQESNFSIENKEELYLKYRDHRTPPF
jgi:hypothetical protein